MLSVTKNVGADDIKLYFFGFLNDNKYPINH